MRSGQGGQPGSDGRVCDYLHDHRSALGKLAGCCRLQLTFCLLLEASPVAAGQAGDDTVHCGQRGADLLPS
jgi:hypothetical protein